MKNQHRIWIYSLTFGLFLFLVSGCKKEANKQVPSLTVSIVSEIKANSATAGGTITSDGGDVITARGVCWSTSNLNPTITDSKTNNGAGAGSFTSSIIGLNPGTTYYFRAYAINSVGTGYSNQSAFTTLAFAPILTTTDLTNITSISARSGGIITSDGGSPIVVHGVCWSTSPNPTISNNKTADGTGAGNFISSLVGISPNTTYYLRAYATNSAGTSYGNQLSFTTMLIVGDLYQGGILAYILQPGDPGYIIGQTHGIVVAQSDQTNKQHTMVYLWL